MLTVSRNSSIFVFLLLSGLHRHLSVLFKSIFLTISPGNIFVYLLSTAAMAWLPADSPRTNHKPRLGGGALTSWLVLVTIHYRKFLLNWAFLLRLLHNTFNKIQVCSAIQYIFHNISNRRKILHIEQKACYWFVAWRKYKGRGPVSYCYFLLILILFFSGKWSRVGGAYLVGGVYNSTQNIGKV